MTTIDKLIHLESGRLSVRSAEKGGHRLMFSFKRYEPVHPSIVQQLVYLETRGKYKSLDN